MRVEMIRLDRRVDHDRALAEAVRFGARFGERSNRPRLCRGRVCGRLRRIDTRGEIEIEIQPSGGERGRQRGAAYYDILRLGGKHARSCGHWNLRMLLL